MNKLLFHYVLPFAMLFAFPLLSLSGVESSAAKKPLDRLIEGNNRYITSTTVCHEDWTAKRTALVENQKPYAVIVTCSDSRVPPEIVFDQTLGDLFIVRVAGNVVDDFAIGSIEYGVNVLGADLVLVLGHSNCGAVEAALKGMKFDNHIQEIINEMQPAIAATKGQTENILEKTIKANVKVVVDELRTSKPLLSKLAREGKLTVIGGYYDLATGKVEFLTN